MITSSSAAPKQTKSAPVSTSISALATAILDRAQAAFGQDDVAVGFAQLIDDLDRLRNSMSVSEWRSFVQHTFREHPLKETLRQDPFTRHAFDKPRGYAGDAELIDYIYGYGNGIVLPACTPKGRSLYAAAMETVPCRAVRARCHYLARVLDSLGRHKNGARAVSIAAGHLREVADAPSCAAGRFDEIVALDQDERSLQTITEAYSAIPAVRSMPGRVRSLITGRVPLQGFDLAYSTGLFDYLNQRTARALAAQMFAMLRPGGELVIANFVAGVSGIGYMEACMDWHLTYRGRDAMVDLCADLDPTEIASMRVERDSTEGILFLHVTRAS